MLKSTVVKQSSTPLGQVGIRLSLSLLALGTIPARAATESHFGDGGAADGTLLLRVDFQLLDELAFRAVHAAEVMHRRAAPLDRELENAFRLPHDRITLGSR